MSRPLSATVVRLLGQSRWTSSDARVVLGAVAASGLSVAEFAREHWVDYQRLNTWRRRLEEETRATPHTHAGEPVVFRELPAPPIASVAAPRYEIHLPSGEVLRVEGAVDVAALGALLDLLRNGARAC